MKNVYLCILTNQMKMNSFNDYLISFGAPYADATASKGADVQPYKYNGKELDLMHGLNTYDYGARQHDPILARWDRIDPHCEKYYNVSPYAYCHNNPVMLVDPNGMDDYYTSDGQFLGSNNKKTDYIYISDDYRQLKDGSYAINSRVSLPESDISAKALSKIFTDIVKKMGCDVSQLDGGQINVVKWDVDLSGNIDEKNIDTYGNCLRVKSYTNARTEGNNITASFGAYNRWMFETRSNIQCMLGVHEYRNHFWKGLSHWNDDGSKNYSANVELFNDVMKGPIWDKTTQSYKENEKEYRSTFLGY